MAVLIMWRHIEGKFKEVNQIRNIAINYLKNNKKIKDLFKCTFNVKIMQLKILKPRLLLKNHRKVILAREIMKPI
jgi:hypothetical protein